MEIHSQANKSHKQSVETLSILTIQLQFSLLAFKQMFPSKGPCMLKVSLRLNVLKNSKLLLKINKEENKRMVQRFTFYHE